MDEVIETDVLDCARCGQTHKQLLFRKLTRPGPRHSYWAPCPTNKEPIMMAIVEDSKKRKRK